MVDLRRTFAHNAHPPDDGPVLYWMSRDQRVRDNWALLYAAELARERRVPLLVAFCVAPSFPGATLRAYGFLFGGLREVEKILRGKGVAFFLLEGEPGETVAAFARKTKAGTVVTDFDPLRVKRGWVARAAKELAVPLVEVDAHNVVPCRAASPKLEFAARTIRPKIHRLLPEFLTEFPALRLPEARWTGSVPEADWDGALARLAPDASVPEVDWIRPGEKAAHRALAAFLDERLVGYDESRNDPTVDGQSDLSPYFHFGQLSPQRVALAVRTHRAPSQDRAAYLEELIVRRELSDNFCFYNPHYDTFDGFPSWAKASLDAHRDDPRPYLYTRAQFERAQTHDALWNAAQTQMTRTGKMHGYLRMYWAKKILEWTESPEQAMKIAVWLNDRYELDGRDPNGYVGAAWSIGGVHDRSWGNRAVFGGVRYMNEAGCRRKFDADAYVLAQETS